MWLTWRLCLQARHNDVEELYAFSSERKMASVLVREPDGLVLYNKARTSMAGLIVAFLSFRGNVRLNVLGRR